MSKKYAFLLMGKDFDPQRDHACFPPAVWTAISSRCVPLRRR